MYRYTDDIVVYENFISEKECDAIIKVLEKQEKNGALTWMPISFYESYSSNLPQDNSKELEEFGLTATFFSDMEKRFMSAVASVHNIDINKVSKIGYHTQKWEPGAYARPHSDNTDINGNASPFERSRYAAFLYLNDDFKGGILKFNKQNIELKPKIGLLTAFAGGFNNIHEVSLIESGVRYTIGSFWDDREESDYSLELRQQWEKEMKEIREKQEIEKKEWQSLLKNGYKISKDGKKYRVGEK